MKKHCSTCGTYLAAKRLLEGWEGPAGPAPAASTTAFIAPPPLPGPPSAAAAVAAAAAAAATLAETPPIAPSEAKVLEGALTMGRGGGG